MMRRSYWHYPSFSYHNSYCKDTFGKDGVKPKKWTIIDIEGNNHTFNTEILSGDIVRSIRNQEVSKIDIELK